MLIGQVMEKTPDVLAEENMADRLADRVRNLWLDRAGEGSRRCEVNFFEDPEGIGFLRKESFPNLQGIDYIFRWWIGSDIDDLAGDLEVLWKVRIEESISIYKTTIRFANRDFVLGNISTESRKREMTRDEFRKAFKTWKHLYLQTVVKHPIEERTATE